MPYTTPFAQLADELARDALDGFDWKAVPLLGKQARPLVERLYASHLARVDANPAAVEAMRPLLMRAVAASGVTVEDYAAFVGAPERAA